MTLKKILDFVYLAGIRLLTVIIGLISLNTLLVGLVMGNLAGVLTAVIGITLTRMLANHANDEIEGLRC